MIFGKRNNIILLLVYQDLIITYIVLEINLKTALELKLINKINESNCIIKLLIILMNQLIYL
ncbi:hypothetical protein NIES806_15520 [Dolichospermum compactum NIES-806]|uniref:Uncharacterized protein n=1 Tax=Dolichospermum compactum NIES-806 TaxID=1973481 RepID=A0A1Z4V1T3_9CYAN|nr:hypothetical protein NIES806_15520 [Dolichospermum compactum NIES-806]